MKERKLEEEATTERVSDAYGADVNEMYIEALDNAISIGNDKDVLSAVRNIEHAQELKEDD